MSNLGILLSGRGSNFLAIHENIRQGKLRASIVCVISDQAAAPGLGAAAGLDIPSYFINPAGRPKAQFESEVVEKLEFHGAQLICLAGYMRILSPAFVRRFPGRIVNVHPSLLPAFPGLHAQRQALEYGVRISGCTVHIVDAGMDTGPIIRQIAVPVDPGDDEQSLADRILQQEHRAYSLALADLIENKYVINGRRIEFI